MAFWRWFSQLPQVGYVSIPWRGRFVSSFLGQAHLQRARAAFLQEFRNHAVVVETEAFRQAVEVVRCHFGLTHVAFLQVIYLEYLGIMFIIYGFILLWIFFLLIKGVHQEVKFDKHHLRTGEKDSRRNDWEDGGEYGPTRCLMITVHRNTGTMFD